MSTITWKKLELEDEALIQSYYEKEPLRNCEFTFGNNYLWHPFYQVDFAIVEDSLVFRSMERSVSVSFPQGASDLRKAIDALTEWFAEQKSPFAMHLVSPENFKRLEELWPGRFEIEYDRDSADYVYERQKLKALSGRSLHGKKNHCNQFKKRYEDWSYERITPENKAECLDMLEQWWACNKDPENEEKEEELQVSKRALEYLEQLGLTGGLLRAEGRVVAFSIGEPCGKDMFVVHIEKAFSDVQGAYTMINQQFVEHEMEAYTFVNREEDTGSEGLRKAKLSYHPIFLMEKGLVKERRIYGRKEEL